MSLYLGIDGGGTSCRAVLGDGDGRVLGHGTAGPSNIWTDPDAACANILTAASDALAAAGQGPDMTRLNAMLGLAGANVPGVPEAVAARLPFARTRIESDGWTALKGALGEGDGIMLITGTGSVFGVQRAGAVRMAGGWGFRLGDHASGARMGRELLDRALLAHDGLAGSSQLLREVVAEAGGPAGLVARMGDARPADFAAYVPRLLTAAEAGDGAAQAVLERAEAVLVNVIERLGDGDRPPVCCLGGIGPVFARRLEARFPGRIAQAKGSALDGALAMARRLR